MYGILLLSDLVVPERVVARCILFTPCKYVHADPTDPNGPVIVAIKFGLRWMNRIFSHLHHSIAMCFLLCTTAVYCVYIPDVGNIVNG